ncbi:hypothetical protein QEN19_001944 [Hanseniaspora menglaensis]
MLKSFKSGGSSKNKKITIGDISSPKSNIPDTQLKSLNTISIQKAQMMQQNYSEKNEEFFGHKDFSRVSSKVSINDTNSGYFNNKGGIRNSSDISVKKTFVDRVASSVSAQSSQSLGSSGGNHLYGVVLYDFEAERNDELDCNAGENLIIFAHHDSEWFIAKTIDRIGGPGLVPCSFVMVVDLASGFTSTNSLEKDIEISGLPSVVEWKNNIQQQKSKNIDLKNNRINSYSATSGQVHSNMSTKSLHEPMQRDISYTKTDSNSVIPSNLQPTPVYKTQENFNNSSYSVTSSTNKRSVYSQSNKSLDDQDIDFILEAKVTEYIWEDQKYKFIVNCLTSFSKDRSLKRSYEDFYNLQINILESFPEESGKVIMADGNMSQRIVPFIPGPVPYVTEDITKKRLADLNTYVNELINLPNSISRSSNVLKLFELENNGYDYEKEHKNHLRSISQDNYPELLIRQDKEIEEQENSNLKSIPEPQNQSISHNIFNSNTISPLQNHNESNHGTVGLDEENTLKLKSLQLVDQTANQTLNTINIKGMGIQNANNPSFNNNSTTVSPSKLTINTHVANVMDTSQSNNTITDLVNTPMTATPGAGKSTKIKFYYDDDIFALLLNTNITMLELHSKILKKIEVNSFRLYNKVGLSLKEEIITDRDLQQSIALKQKIAIVE